MISIYHNPRCSKSRDALKLLEEREQKFQIIKYMETPPSIEELEGIIRLLNIEPMELVRIKEPEWIENFKDKNLTDAEIIDAIVKFPRLMERPIVVNGERAVIGRPIEKIIQIL